MNDDGNKRIFVWICNGWIAIIIHLVTSLLMIKIVDEDYDFNVAGIAQSAMEYLQEEKDKVREQMEEQGL